MNKLTANTYITTLMRMLKEPGAFFAEITETSMLKFSLLFLSISCAISTAGGLSVCTPENPLIAGSIYIINAVGMVFVAAFFSYILCTMFMTKRIGISKFIMIYAFSSGTTLIAAWIPFMMILTEPWKWWLAGTGMIHTFGFKRNHVILLICTSILCIILFFLSALSAMGFIKTVMAPR